MIPIFEQGQGRGIGLTVDRFRQRFSQICENHLRTGRAKAFAFIFYDFIDSDFRAVLEHQGVFAKLDRLAGHELSIFYLHKHSANVAKEFNAEFLAKIGIQEKVGLPCIVFFRMEGDTFTDIVVAELDHTDFTTAFHELYVVVENYIANIPPPKNLRLIKVVLSGAKNISSRIFNALLGAALGSLF